MTNNGTEFNGIVSTNTKGLENRKLSYGAAVGTSNTDTTGFSSNSRAVGITTDGTKSGIVCEQDTNIKMCIKY